MAAAGTNAMPGLFPGTPMESCSLSATRGAAAPISVAGGAAAVWGLSGTILLLAQAVWRMLPVVAEAFTHHRLGVAHWAGAVAGVAFMGFYEGYKGFQRGFSPRVVVRALHLARNPRPLHVLLAPLFCMGLLHASRRRLVASWAILCLVVAAVAAVRGVPQPARGIVDLGVVVGLAWGLVALLAYALRAAAGLPPRVPADLPAQPGSRR
jgi:hypothetical protein